MDRPAPPSRNSAPVTRILGLGLDNDDGHTRLTQGPDFDLRNGSEESHRLMQEWCLRIDEAIRDQGRDMGDLSRDEFFTLAESIAHSLDQSDPTG